MTFITLQKSSRVFWRGGVSVFFLCSGLMSLPVQASTNEVDLMRLAATNGLPAFLHFQLALKTGVPDGNQIKTSEFQSNSEFTEIINQKKKASIGVPFQTYSLSLKDVQSFKSGNDVGLLLKPNKNQSIFPVTTGKDVLGGITVEKSDSGWKPTEYTTGGFVSELSVTRDQMIFTSTKSTNTESPFLVQMKSLNYNFLGFHGTNGEILLRPLRSYPALGLSTNINYNAETVLEHLEPIANRYNGLPR